MKYKVITISREYGAGGHSVAKVVAEKLGYQIYDAELITKTMEQTGLAREFVEESGEYTSMGNLFSLAIAGIGRNGTSIDEMIWTTQCQVIDELAAQGNCIFVGRCADYVLRERKDVLNVFLHADMEHRKKRVMQMLECESYGLEKRIQDKDKKRRTHYNFHTDMEWGKIDNYDICLDTGVLGYERCGRIIVDLVKDM